MHGFNGEEAACGSWRVADRCAWTSRGATPSVTITGQVESKLQVLVHVLDHVLSFLVPHPGARTDPTIPPAPAWSLAPSGWVRQTHVRAPVHFCSSGYELSVMFSRQVTFPISWWSKVPWLLL